MEYTREQLVEARRQIGSTLHKLRETIRTFEAKEEPQRYKSQITLARRRVEAFIIANELIGRELVLLKVNATNKTRQDIMTICDIMGAKVDDISPNSLTLELSDTPDRIDTFEAMLRPFSILEVVRTGVIALQKGGGKI